MQTKNLLHSEIFVESDDIISLAVNRAMNEPSDLDDIVAKVMAEPIVFDFDDETEEIVPVVSDNTVESPQIVSEHEHHDPQIICATESSNPVQICVEDNEQKQPSKPQNRYTTDNLLLNFNMPDTQDDTVDKGLGE